MDKDKRQSKRVVRQAKCCGVLSRDLIRAGVEFVYQKSVFNKRHKMSKGFTK